jgi:hypothetical protein
MNSNTQFKVKEQENGQRAKYTNMKMQKILPHNRQASTSMVVGMEEQHRTQHVVMGKHASPKSNGPRIPELRLLEQNSWPLVERRFQNAAIQ